MRSSHMPPKMKCYIVSGRQGPLLGAQPPRHDDPEIVPTGQWVRRTTLLSVFLTGVLGPLPSPSKSQPPTHLTDKSRVGNHLVCWPVGSLNTSQDKTLQRSEFTVYPIGDHHRLLGHRTRDTPPRAPTHGLPVLLSVSTHTTQRSSSSRQHYEYLKSWCWASPEQMALVYFAADEMPGFLNTAATKQPFAKHRVIWHCPLRATKPGYSAGDVTWLPAVQSSVVLLPP